MKTHLNLILSTALLPAALFADAVKLEIQADSPVLQSGTSKTVLVKVEVEGIGLSAADRPPVNLAIVIDKSGSMSGDRIAFARKGAMEAVRRLGRDDVFSVVVYDQVARTLIPSQQLTDIDYVARKIRGIQAGGMTNIFDGLRAGHAELEKHLDKNLLNRLILLSDGLANVGNTLPEHFADLGRRLSRDGMVVSSVGLGVDYNERLMSDLAQAGEGNNYFVSHPGALPKIFEAEIGHLVSTVARGVTISITLPDGVTIERVLGRQYRMQGNRLEIDFHDLAGGHRKYSVFELNVPEGVDGEVLEPLEARATYRRAADNESAETNARAEFRFTSSASEVQDATNHGVRQAWAELRQAEVQTEVLDLLAQGRRDEARGVLNQAPVAAAHRGWDAAAHSLDRYREREESILSERDFSEEERRARHTESYQLRTQQASGRVAIPGSGEN